MNDEQLTQLFAAQNIPAPTDAAKAAALTAAMAAFAEQPPHAAPLEPQKPISLGRLLINSINTNRVMG